MALTPLPGVKPSDLLDALVETLSEVERAASAPGQAYERMIAYSRWATQSVRRLGTRVSGEDLERLVLTPRHWHIQGMDPGGLAEIIGPVVALELEERKRALAEAVEAQSALRKRWGNCDGLVIVADTNVFAEHDEPIDERDWVACAEVTSRGNLPRPAVHLVVPMLVVDELDRLKRHNRKEVRRRARNTLKLLEQKLLGTATKRVVLRERHVDGGLTLELFLDELGHRRLPDADDELIDRAASLARVSGHEVHFITGDTGALLRARFAGLTAHRLPSPA